MEPVINFRGTKVGLGPYSRSMISPRHRWSNDPEYAMWAGNPLATVTMPRMEEHMATLLRERSPDGFAFCIYELGTGNSIGICDLSDVSYLHGTAVYGIGIGERTYWGIGYGTEASFLAMDFAFNVLGLHNVLLETVAYNTRAITSYEKVGFKFVGRKRGAHKLGEKRYDFILMDCLASEFVSPLPPILPVP